MTPHETREAVRAALNHMASVMPIDRQPIFDRFIKFHYPPLPATHEPNRTPTPREIIEAKREGYDASCRDNTEMSELEIREQLDKVYSLPAEPPDRTPQQKAKEYFGLTRKPLDRTSPESRLLKAAKAVIESQRWHVIETEDQWCAGMELQAAVEEAEGRLADAEPPDRTPTDEDAKARRRVRAWDDDPAKAVVGTLVCVNTCFADPFSVMVDSKGRLTFTHAQLIDDPEGEVADG